MALYPINLNISNKLCVVVGGGQVATRKVRSLIECDAKVVVVSPQISQDLLQLVGKEKLTWIERGFIKGDLESAVLCIAATDNLDIQQAVKEEAKSSEILLNSIDDPDESDFHVPSKVRRGDLLLTVSTGGGSPALSKLLRKKIETQYGSEYELLIRFLCLVRKHVTEDGREASEHKVIFSKLVEEDLLILLAQENWIELHNVLQEYLPDQLVVKRLVEQLQEEWQRKINATAPHLK